MPAKIRRRIVFSSAAAVVVIGGLAMGVAFASRQPASQPPSHHRSGLALGLVRHFALLRRGSRADASGTATLPQRTLEGIAAPGSIGSQFGLDVAAAKSVSVDGTQVWVIPGSAGVCTLALPHPGGPTDPGGVCGPTVAAEAGQHIQREASPSGNETIIGLAPDGNTHATVTVRGVSTSVPVVDNVYVTSGRELSGPSSTVTVNDASGQPETHGF
jgi:hypothetical protein